jgi:hypothetical protein
VRRISDDQMEGPVNKRKFILEAVTAKAIDEE